MDYTINDAMQTARARMGVNAERHTTEFAPLVDRLQSNETLMSRMSLSQLVELTIANAQSLARRTAGRVGREQFGEDRENDILRAVDTGAVDGEFADIIRVYDRVMTNALSLADPITISRITIGEMVAIYGK